MTHSDASRAVPTPLAGPQGCRAREVIDLVANKWALSIVDTLGNGPKRFSELRRSISGISQKVLTANLRSLERDGILTRTVYAVMPPNVTYELTPIGHTLLDATVPLVQWSLANIAAIDTSRAEFDNRSSSELDTARSA